MHENLFSNIDLKWSFAKLHLETVYTNEILFAMLFNIEFIFFYNL